MRIFLLWSALAACLLLPVDAVRICAAMILFTFFPGWAFLSLFDPEENNMLVSFLYGGAFMIIVVYYCGWFLYWYIPLIISLCSVLFLEKKKIPFPSITRSTVFLCACMLFMATYLYPWEHAISFFPPGEEMKLHLLITTSIQHLHSLPTDYSPLYPEISHLGQPLGFHGMTVFLSDAARASPITTGTLLGIFTGSMGCISLFLLGKTLFDEKTGYAAAFSFAFLSFFSHQLGASGSYVLLAGITFQVAAVSALIKVARSGQRRYFLLAGLLCAACLSTDVNAFLPLALFILLYVLIHPSYFPVLASIILFSVPQLARFSVRTPTALEIQFLEEWFHQNLISGAGELWIILFSMGPLLLLFALLYLGTKVQKIMVVQNEPERDRNTSREPVMMSIKKIIFSPHPFIFLGIYWGSFIIPVLLGSLFPFWHIINPQVIFRMSAIPLAVLSGMALVTIRSALNYRWGALGLIVMCILIQYTDPFLTLPHSPPTVTQDSLCAYRWLEEHTPPDSYVCNFISHGDSSTWIPVAAHRRVFLPSHLYYHRDNVMSSLKLPERFTDIAILTTIPHTQFSYEILKKNGFTHVYIDEKSPIQQDILINSTLYTLEFYKGTVYIFSLTDTVPPCVPKQYHPGKIVMPGKKSYFHLPGVKKGDVLILYYKDRGTGNVDIEINGSYVSTIYRFNSQNHYYTAFVCETLPSLAVSVLPYETSVEIEYLVIYQCNQQEKTQSLLPVNQPWLWN